MSALALSTGMALVDARDAVDAHALESFTELTTAWETGDSKTVAEWWGRQTGSAPDVALGGLSKAFGVCKLIAKSTPWARRALAAKEAQLIAQLDNLGPAARAADLPTGAPLSYEIHGRNTFGIDRVMNDKVQKFVDDFGVAIGVRRRGPASIAKIENGTHGPKPFHLKAKNASATADIEFLGMIDDADTVMIKPPPPKSQVEAALDVADASSDLRKEVLSRHKTRMEEWHGKGVDLETGTGGNYAKSERAKWIDYERNGIPVPKKGQPLDYKTNVLDGRSLPPDDVIYERVPFRFRTEVAPDGKPNWIAEIDRGDGFKPVTGDMDAMVVTKADFDALPEAKKIEFYDRAHELGFEHVESASWNDPAGRNGYLRDHSIHTEGSEAMYTWMPNAGTPSDALRPPAQLVQHRRRDQDPGFDLPPRREREDPLGRSRSRRPDPRSGPTPTGYIDPKTIFLIDPNCPSVAAAEPEGRRSCCAPHRTAPVCSVIFDRDPDASSCARTTWRPRGLDRERWLAAVRARCRRSVGSAGRAHLVRVGTTVATTAYCVSCRRRSARRGRVGERRVEIAIAFEADLDLVAGIDEWFAMGDCAWSSIPAVTTRSSPRWPRSDHSSSRHRCRTTTRPARLISVVDPADTPHRPSGWPRRELPVAVRVAGPGTPGGSGGGNGSGASGDAAGGQAGGQTGGAGNAGTLPFTGAALVRFLLFAGLGFVLLGTLLVPHDRKGRRRHRSRA